MIEGFINNYEGPFVHNNITTKHDECLGLGPISASHFWNILPSNTWRIPIGALIVKAVITVKLNWIQLSWQV